VRILPLLHVAGLLCRQTADTEPRQVFINSGTKQSKKVAESSQCLKIEKVHGHFQAVESTWLVTKQAQSPSLDTVSKRALQVKGGRVWEHVSLCHPAEIHWGLAECFSSHSAAACWVQLHCEALSLSYCDRKKPQPISKLENTVILQWNEAASPWQVSEHERYLAISTQKQQYKAGGNRKKKKPNHCQWVLQGKLVRGVSHRKQTKELRHKQYMHATIPLNVIKLPILNKHWSAAGSS